MGCLATIVQIVIPIHTISGGVTYQYNVVWGLPNVENICTNLIMILVARSNVWVLYKIYKTYIDSHLHDISQCFDTNGKPNLFTILCPMKYSLAQCTLNSNDILRYIETKTNMTSHSWKLRHSLVHGARYSVYCKDHYPVNGGNYAIISQLEKKNELPISVIHLCNPRASDTVISVSHEATNSWMRIQRRKQLRKQYIFIILLSEHHGVMPWESGPHQLLFMWRESIHIKLFYSAC